MSRRLAEKTQQTADSSLALRGIGMVSGGDANLLEANLPRFEPLTLKLIGLSNLIRNPQSAIGIIAGQE
jgi:hypothetical protein